MLYQRFETEKQPRRLLDGLNTSTHTYIVIHDRSNHRGDRTGSENGNHHPHTHHHHHHPSPHSGHAPTNGNYGSSGSNAGTGSRENNVANSERAQNSGILKLRGLPFSSNKQDIQQFFEGMRMCLCADLMSLCMAFWLSLWVSVFPVCAPLILLCPCNLTVLPRLHNPPRWHPFRLSFRWALNWRGLCQFH